MFGRLRQLIIAFFVYNCVSVVAYFMLSIMACFFGIKALDELKDKKRDETGRGHIEMGLPM